jgi:thiol-disulfide isomerase/thioredoxin
MFFLALQTDLYAQEIPNIKLSTLDGASFQTKQFNEAGNKPVVLSFWATWCIPCLNELTAINDNLDSWKAAAVFEFYAISEDDSRTSKRVQPLVKGKDWNFTVLLDKNQDLKRELNLANIPYTIIVKNGKIIYRHLGYVAGNEQELYKIIKENQ